MTLIQRFGSALNLNMQFHMLSLHGVPQPGPREFQILVEHIAERIGLALEKQGLVERDIENAWLAEEGEGGPLDDLLDYSVTYPD